MVHLTDKNPESINFEAQIENNLNALDNIPAEQDIVDGVGDDFSTKNDVDKLSHHVSCEDLLKFANTKPSSRTRGNDSDEVRIMSKVLGKDVSKLLIFINVFNDLLRRLQQKSVWKHWIK